MFGLVDLVWFGLVGLVWLIWFCMVSSTFKSRKSQPRTASWNYSGRVGLGRVGLGRVGSSDYIAISVQLQLQLPTGTELGNIT